MMPIIEFETWLTQCCYDAKSKLCLTEIEISFALLEEAKRWLLPALVESEDRYRNE
ncbi:MAG: hypothetical protein Q8M94_22500 [Ignavibacteria bacterium]|nr:hypothetical protein [Ignavibacteria bacterium]